ncbi:MAG: hypothetical protein R3228_18580 [Halioglobus sp.]|nr:hypothetical protein [Halioglobus sp.]
MIVYLHIGYPKTGSSAIQSHISCNRGWFRRRGLLIPSTGFTAGAGHAFLLPQIVTAKDDDSRLDSSALDRLGAELDAAQRDECDSALLSWEGFAEASPAAMALLARSLASHRVVLLAYVREHGELFQSETLQHIEKLRLGRGEVLFERDQLLAGLPQNYDYHAALSRWRDAFDGALEVRTRLFDRDRLASGNVVLDFVSWLGLAPDERFSLQRDAVNVSLDTRSGSLLCLARAAGQAEPSLLSLCRALLEVIKQHGASTRDFLTSAEREEIWQHFSASTQQMFRDFAPENALPGEEGFALPLVKRNEPPALDELQFHAAVRAALARPQLETWQGNVLVRLWLSRVAAPPNVGWRGTERDGTWSRGHQSVLAFLLPETDPEEGPRALRLTIAGHYFGANSATDVIIDDHRDTLDLTRAELEIALDEAVRRDGVHVTLQHQEPGLPHGAEGDPAVDGMAFKLTYLDYNFIW